MKILRNNFDLNEALKGVSNLGFVPTMGSFHRGHISLFQKSKRYCNKTIVSIFINPKQFNNSSDYKNYPKNIRKDIAILKKLKIHFVFIPKFKDVFKKNSLRKILLKKKDKILCAKFRKGHFEGVLEVMNSLTKLIKPKKILMGEKDFQQLFLVKRFIEKKYKTKIIPCKTIREKNKLALSSRNLLLKHKDKKIAGAVAQNLIKFKQKLNSKKNINNLLKNKKENLKKDFKLKIDYLELRNKKNLQKSKNKNGSKLFIAYYLNKIRLIDNF